MIKFMIKGSTYELSLEVKPSQIIFTIAVLIALLKMASPAQSDTGFKHSVEDINLMTNHVIKDEDGFYKSKN